MSNTKTTTKNRRYGKFLVRRRLGKVQSFTKHFPKSFTFVEQHQGKIFAKKLDTGAYQVRFKAKDGRSAFAYGGTFEMAYQNVIRMFNQKYAV